MERRDLDRHNPEGPSPPNRRNHAMTYDSARGVTVLFGGETVVMDGETRVAISSDETWEWDGETWTERTPDLAGSARSGPHGYDITRWRLMLKRGVTLLAFGAGAAKAQARGNGNGTDRSVRPSQPLPRRAAHGL